LLASADNDAVIRVYESRTGRLRSRYDSLSMESFALAFSADSRKLVVSGADRVAVVLDPTSGKELWRVPALKDPIANVAILADGETVIAWTVDATQMSRSRSTIAWNVRTRQQVTLASDKMMLLGPHRRDGLLALSPQASGIA